RGLPGSPGGGPKLYGRSAVQFFRVFPGAYPTFKLRTAVRMSATFPYVSPAVSLPTIPPRRIVDAGYYDNYGVDLLCSWVSKSCAWINENTSGVALIQIRAYPSETRRLEYFDPDRESVSTGITTWPATAFEFLTSPAE